ncbi:MAG: methyl-accepting chemotaxis protein [Spirochaetaceae bacterium]
MRKVSLFFILLPLTLLIIFLPFSGVVKASLFIVLYLLDFIFIKRKYIKDIKKDADTSIKTEMQIDTLIDNDNSLAEEIETSQKRENVDTGKFDECFQQIYSLIDSVDLDKNDNKLDELTNKLIPHISEASGNSSIIKGGVTQIFTISDNVAKTAKTAFDLANSVKQSVAYVAKTLEKAILVTEELDTKSKEITKILDIMSNISSMVHILSINASIVSARAGIHGKGFKVVAKEIRNLAVNTDKSLSDIDVHVSEVQDSVKKVAVEIKEAGRAIEAEESELRDVAGALQGVLLSVEIINTVSDSAKDTTDEQSKSFVTLRESVDDLLEYLNVKVNNEQGQLSLCRNNMLKISTDMNTLFNDSFKGE